MPGLGERHELQVAIDFPQVLDITHLGGIPVIHILAEGQRRLDAGLRIDVPARRESELHAAKREHIEGSCEDPVGRARVARGIEAAREFR